MVAHSNGNKNSSRQKKVAVFIHENQYGGGTKQTYYILEQLEEMGVQALLISNAKDSWLGKTIANNNIQPKLYYTDFLQRSLNPFKDFACFIYILKVLIQEKPDAIIAAGVKLIGLTSVAGWLAGVPKRYAVIRGQGAPPNSKMIQIIYVMEKFMALLGSKFITVAEHDRQTMLDRKISRPDHITTVHNGTDVERFQPNPSEKNTLRKKLNIPEDAFVIGMAGRLTDQKRYDLFIDYMVEICKRHDHAYGLIIGDGKNRETLQEKIDDTPYADKILITGFIENINEAYWSLDFSVLFTVFEGLPNVLIESAACGLPMLVDDVCGNKEVVQHKQNGFVIEPDAIGDAVNYTDELIKNPQMAEAFSRFSREWATQHFDRNTQVKKLINTVCNWEQ